MIRALMKLLYLILLLLSLFRPALKASPAVHARILAARIDIDDGLTKALDAFRIDCGRYPTTAEGWAALIHCPTNLPAERWHGPYLDKVPVDSWGSVYVYVSPGVYHPNGFDLYSCGTGGVSKNNGSDPEDINNWDPNSPHRVGDDTPKTLVTALVGGNLVFLALNGCLAFRQLRANIKPPVKGQVRKEMGSVIWFVLGWGLLVIWPARLLPVPDGIIISAFLGWWVFGVVLAIAGLWTRSKIGVLAGLLGLLDFLIFIPLLCVPRLAGR